VKILSNTLLCCLACLLVSCSKKGPYGFETGQKYKFMEGSEIYKVVDAGEDFVIFHQIGTEKGDGNYRLVLTKKLLSNSANRWKIQD